MYETEYGICDHTENTRPLSSVRFNEAEKFTDHYLFESYMELFLYKKVNKHLGLSFDEFIDRPRYEIDTMITTIDKVSKQEDSVNENLINQMKQQNAQKPGK